MISCKIRFPVVLSNEQMSDIISHDFNADTTFYDDSTCIINTEASTARIAALCVRNGFEILNAEDKIIKKPTKATKTTKKSKQPEVIQ